MADGTIHYELFIRRNVQAGWTLDSAGETRALMVEAAEQALKDKRAVGVKVTKETRQSSGEYLSVVVLSRGDLEPPRRKGRDEEEQPAPLCVSPSDLYTVHARARIARLFEGVLRRQGVTAFELLHRPDLVEALDASGMEIQGAIQKVSIPEAKATGVSTHETMRRFQRLADGAVARLLGDARRDIFPDLERDGLSAVLRRVDGLMEGGYLLSVAVAGRLAPLRSMTAKVERLLDLAEACAAGDTARPLLLSVLEQPLSEILAGRTNFSDMLGEGPHPLGRVLMLMTSLIVSREAHALVSKDSELSQAMPPPSAAADRLTRWLGEPAFASASAALARRVLEDLAGPRRLQPDDPAAEIVVLRALARLLILSPKVASPDAVQAAVSARSRALVSGDFVQAYLDKTGGGPLAEAAALVRLGENVVGAPSKRAVGEWLRTLVDANRFERALRGESACAHRLHQLAELQLGLERMGLEAPSKAALAARLGDLGDAVEAESRLISALGRANGGVLARLSALLRLASGEAAPHGPVTRRARAEALKLARDPALRTELAHAPAAEMERVRQLLQAASQAAA